MSATDRPAARRLLARTLAACLGLGFLGAAGLAAQADPGSLGVVPYVPGPYEPVRRDPIGTRLIDLPTPYTVGKRGLEVLFTHRFQQPVEDGGSHNLWGLDSGADVGIGLAYGVTRSFDLSILRSSFQEDFEVAGKFLVIEQARRVPLSIAVRAGGDLLGRSGVADPQRPFAQLILSRQIVPGVDLLVTPSWVRDTPLLHDAWNVPIGLTLPLPAGSFLALEYVPKSRDLASSVAAWHAAFSKPIGQHLFSFVVGNSRATTVDQYLGGDSAAGFRARDVRLGFNLVRTFQL